MGWTFSSGTGRGWTSAGRGRKARKSTDPKIWQKCVKCYWRICITVWCFDQGKHYILWLLNGLSANQIITSCTKDQMNSFSFISFSSPFLAQMCGHNLCNLQSALPRCAPRVLSISAGRGGTGRGKACFSRGRAGQTVFPRWGGASIPDRRRLCNFLTKKYTFCPKFLFSLYLITSLISLTSSIPTPPRSLLLQSSPFPELPEPSTSIWIIVPFICWMTKNLTNLIQF